MLNQWLPSGGPEPGHRQDQESIEGRCGHATYTEDYGFGGWKNRAENRAFLVIAAHLEPCAISTLLAHQND